MTSRSSTVNDIRISEILSIREASERWEEHQKRISDTELIFIDIKTGNRVYFM